MTRFIHASDWCIFVKGHMNRKAIVALAALAAIGLSSRSITRITAVGPAFAGTASGQTNGRAKTISRSDFNQHGVDGIEID